MIKIAFSWDDGAVEDLKLMELSAKYEMPGIFFIPSSNQERSVMTRSEIKILDENKFEIGAHTFSHTYLKGLDSSVAETEILNGKNFLQDLLGKEISHFCFPGGRFDDNLVRISQKYFKSARTADTGALIKKPAFLVKPTFHFYNRGINSLLFHSFNNNYTLFRTIFKIRKNKDYFTLIESVIDALENAPSNNGIIIWGHSWEINEYNLWNRLEATFEHINCNMKHSKSTYSDLIRSFDNKTPD